MPAAFAQMMHAMHRLNLGSLLSNFLEGVARVLNTAKIVSSFGGIVFCRKKVDDLLDFLARAKFKHCSKVRRRGASTILQRFGEHLQLKALRNA